MGEQAVQRYLRFVLHESVNDPATRERLAAARGFCRRHAWHFLRLEWVTMRDGLSTANIAEGLLKTVDQLLDDYLSASSAGVRGKRVSRARVEKLVRSLTPARECPACALQAGHEMYTLTVLLTVLEEETWRERFALSGGLCLHHLRRALTAEEFPDGIRLLVEDHRRRLRELLADLEEYIRKHDYRFVAEPYGRERVAIVRATVLLAGNWFDLPGRPPARAETKSERAEAQEEKSHG